MSCIKTVVEKCRYCQGQTIKFGKTGDSQRYRCESCKKTQLKHYANQACGLNINPSIAAHVKEGCGIRSIARLLHISATTVISRIQKIAGEIKKPPVITSGVYEADELKTYIRKKTNDYWVIYALDRENGSVTKLLLFYKALIIGREF
jgi:insertion element IS1 protein InsB